MGRLAAFDLTVTSAQNSNTLLEASVTAGSAALAAETHKHATNDAKCSELGWSCIPIAVETFGCWGAESQTKSLSLLAGHLAITTCWSSCHHRKLVQVTSNLPLVQQAQLGPCAGKRKCITDIIVWCQLYWKVYTSPGME